LDPIFLHIHHVFTFMPLVAPMIRFNDRPTVITDLDEEGVEIYTPTSFRLPSAITNRLPE